MWRCGGVCVCQMPILCDDLTEFGMINKYNGCNSKRSQSKWNESILKISVQLWLFIVANQDLLKVKNRKDRRTAFFLFNISKNF